MTIVSTTYLVLSYNGYTYQTNADMPATVTEGVAARLRQAVSANMPGAYSAGGLVGVKKLSVHGILSAPDGTLATMRSLWDNFKAVHCPGLAAKLFVDTDRYINAEVESIADSQWNGLAYREYEVSFSCADPFWYDWNPVSCADNYQTQPLAVGSNSVIPGGTAPALPVITLSIISYSGGSVTITDSGGAAFTVTPDAVGACVIDCMNEVVAVNSSTNMSVFSGQFLSVPAVGTTWMIATSGTVAISSMSAQWQRRWV
jgi:hypothetical protein